MAASALEGSPATVTPYLLTLCDELAEMRGNALAVFAIGDLAAEARILGDALWLIVRRPGSGGIALRAAAWAGESIAKALKPAPGEIARIRITSGLGVHIVSLRAGARTLPYFRVTTRFTPSAPTRLPFVPRDLYPLDRHDEPLGANGRVHAVQRGLNAGLLYFELDEPAAGSFFYFQI